MDDLDKCILKSIVENQRLAMDFAYLYEPKLFLETDSRVIARTIIDYIKSYRSRPTLEALSDIHKDEPDLVKLLSGFWEMIPDIECDEANYNFNIEKIKNRYCNFLTQSLKQKISTRARGMTENAQNDISLIEQASTEIKSINKERSFVKRTLRNYVSDFKKNYIAKSKNPELGRGIMSGYSCLDFVKNGMRPADLMLMCGETGTGKSMWLNNMAVNMWMQQNKVNMDPSEYSTGFNVMYFSLEMPYDDCFRRTISAMADVPSYGIRDANLNSHETKAMKLSLEFMDQYPAEFDIIDVPRGFTVDELELHFQEARTRYRPDVVFIDYLGLMEDIQNDGDQQDWLKLGQLTGKVHEFARAYQVPVITAVQLNRYTSTSKNSTPIGLHRIGRSSLIAHHATIIAQIENTNDNDSVFKYYIIKNRDGELVHHAVSKKFAHSRIEDQPFDSESRINYSVRNDDISLDVSKLLNETN